MPAGDYNDLCEELEPVCEPLEVKTVLELHIVEQDDRPRVGVLFGRSVEIYHWSSRWVGNSIETALLVTCKDFRLFP